MINEYLIHCYLYYVLNESIISDTEFDKLCKGLLARWGVIKGKHKHLIQPADLAAGTGYSIKEYPPDIIRKAKALLGHRAPAVYKPYRVDPGNEQTKLDIQGMSDQMVINLHHDYRLSRNNMRGETTPRTELMIILLKEELVCRKLISQ